MIRAKLARSTVALMASVNLMMAAPVSAQSDGPAIHGGTVEIPQNKSQVITADRPIAQALIGNPEIADVVALTDRSIYVLGKDMGTTSLTLYDSKGQVLSVLDVSVGPDVQAFRAQVERLMPEASIDAYISGDSLVLTGLATDPGMADRAVRLAQTYAGPNVVNLMGLGSSQQVMLEVRFAEVRRNLNEDVGVNNIITSDSGNFGVVTGDGSSLSNGPIAGALLQGGSVLDTFGIIGGTFRALGLNFESYLNALEARGFAKTLAEPTLVALSGETANFLAGGEFPIPVVQGAGAGVGGNSQITVEFKQFGVSLGFTPTVLGDKTINLVVEPEVSSIDPAASIQLNGISIPGLQTRRASTTLELRDGESFAIAGLLQEDFRTNVSQVPLLGSIPILGSLFRSTEFQNGETELLIVVTPRLVQPISPNQVILPTDRVSDPNPAEAILTGEAYDPLPASEVSRGGNKDSDYEF